METHRTNPRTRWHIRSDVGILILNLPGEGAGGIGKELGEEVKGEEGRRWGRGRGEGASEVFSSDEGRTLEEVDEEQGKNLPGAEGGDMGGMEVGEDIDAE